MGENAIHVQLEYGEAVENRKEILYSQINLIKVLQHIKNYHALRKQELDKKSEIVKKLTLITTNINKINKLLPILKMPKILKKEEEIEEKETREKLVPPRKKISTHPLEYELMNIQKELQALESKA